MPPFRPSASDAELTAAINLMEAAARPVIVAGGGVKVSGGSEALVRLSELLGLPVVTSLNGKDTIADTHPHSVGVVGTYSRGSANRLVGEADLVVFVGTSTGGMTTHFWQVPPMDAAPPDRHRPGSARPQLSARDRHPGRCSNGSDPNGRAPMTNSSEARQAWVDHARDTVTAWREEWRPFTDSEAVPIRPERISAELSWLLPDDSIVVVDTGHAGMWMGGFYDVRSPTQSYMRSAGHLGWAFPASLGAKCASPDRPVVCFTGDSGFWYHIAEVETAVRFGINTITVVNDNHSGNQSMRGFDRVYGGNGRRSKQRNMGVHATSTSQGCRDIGAIGSGSTTGRDLAGRWERAWKPTGRDNRRGPDMEAVAPAALCRPVPTPRPRTMAPARTVEAKTSRRRPSRLPLVVGGILLRILWIVPPVTLRGPPM